MDLQSTKISSFLDDSGDLEAAAFASSSLSSSGVTAAPTEQEMQLAGEAQKSFSAGDFSSALTSLSTLRASRPEDPLVAANLLVTRFKALSSGNAKSTRQSMTDLALELEEALKPTTEASDFESSDCTAAMYNLGLARFFARDIAGAMEVISKLEDSFEKTGVKPGEDLEARLRNLRVAGTMAARAAAPAGMTTQFEDLLLPSEASNGGKKEGDKNSSPGKSFPAAPHTLLLAHFRRLLATRQVKSFRKDLKLASSLVGADALAFEFMRANMEYLKGNHKKAIKLLQNLKAEVEGAPQHQQQLVEQMLPTLVSNAQGCVHLVMGKPEVALYHMKAAMEAHSTALQDLAFRQRPDFLHQVHRNVLAYNTAVCLLHRGDHQCAYTTFKALSVSSLMAASPNLWLRMAECCIAENVQPGDGFREMTTVEHSYLSHQSSPVVKQLGERENRKLVIQMHDKPRQQQHQQSGRGTFGNGMEGCNEQLTLTNAVACLKKAAYLATKRQLGAKLPPLELPITSRLALLRANILLKQSYVSLCLDSHSEALRFAKEILVLQKKTQGSLPQGLCSLARLYAGESLVFLDCISEAAEYLDPKTLPLDASFDALNNSEDAGNSSVTIKTNTNTSVGIACRAMFTYNLAVAFVTRDELDKAWEMLESLWKAKETHQLRKKVLSARLYIQLRKGKVADCRKTIRESCCLEK